MGSRLDQFLERRSSLLVNLAIYPAGFATIGTILLLYRFKLYSPWWLLLALFVGAVTTWATNALLLWIEHRLENEKGAQP